MGTPPTGGFGPFSAALKMATDALKGLGKTLTSTDSPKTAQALAALSLAGGMTGPIGRKVGSLMGGTLSGAARGYAFGGVPGAALGGAMGAAGDALSLGGNANPQAQSTLDQSIELAKARLGSALGADHWLNMAADEIQRMTPKTGKGSPRDASGAAAVEVGKTSWWERAALPSFSLPGLGSLTGGGAAGARGDTTPAAVPRPGMMAPAIIPGVGSAMGQAMSYEDYAKASGMSSLNTSQLEFDKMATQLENMVGLLTSVRDNSEALKRFTPSWR